MILHFFLIDELWGDVTHAHRSTSCLDLELRLFGEDPVESSVEGKRGASRDSADVQLEDWDVLSVMEVSSSSSFAPPSAFFPIVGDGGFSLSTKTR